MQGGAVYSMEDARAPDAPLGASTAPVARPWSLELPEALGTLGAWAKRALAHGSFSAARTQVQSEMFWTVLLAFLVVVLLFGCSLRRRTR